MRALYCALALLCASPAWADPWHPYVFSVDGSTLQSKTAALESGLGYNGVTGSGGGLQPDDSRRVAGWITGAVGITNWAELDGTFLFADDPTNGFEFNQARIDLRFRLLKARPRVPIAISLGIGYQADALIEHAITAVFAASAYLGRVNLTLNVRAAHYFHVGRDPVDVFVTAGAMVRATRWLHLGVEYVGEELEGVFGDDDDGSPGGRHYVGPTGVVGFLQERLRLSGTVGAVFANGDSGPLARVSLAYQF